MSTGWSSNQQQVTTAQIQYVLAIVAAIIPLIFGVRAVVKVIESDVEERKLKKQAEHEGYL